MLRPLERRVLAALLVAWWFCPLAWCWWLHLAIVAKMSSIKDKFAVLALSAFVSVAVAGAWALWVFCFEYYRGVDYVEGTKLYGFWSVLYAVWLTLGPPGFDVWGQASSRAEEIIEIREKKASQAGDVSFASEASAAEAGDISGVDKGVARV